MADSVVGLHLAFVVFVLLGGWLALRWRWVAFLHLPAVVWGVWIELSGRICPLTPLENRFRRLAGQEGYEGGFVEHYVLPVLYPAAMTRNTQLLLGLLVVLVNAIVYAIVIARISRSRSDGA